MFLNKLLGHLLLLHIGLPVLELSQLNSTLAFLLLFLLFGQGELIVSDPPELGEFLLLLFGLLTLLLSSLTLEHSALVDGLFHLKLTALLVLEESVGLVLGFGNLLVEDLLLVVLDGSELGDLGVNHALPLLLLFLKAGLFAFLTHVVHTFFFHAMFLNLTLLLGLSGPLKFGDADLLFV